MANETTEKKMVRLTINGKQVQAEAGSPLILAAAKAGVFVPHYCYHPDLSIAGVCRMCMVEIDKIPKLQIACNQPVAEGMVATFNSPKVKEAVKGALELHLINHPLDCPICDKAGECKLQDYYTEVGNYQSRMDYDAKVHKPKVVDIGPIVLDSERCILCSRCVRFTAEVTKTYEFGIFNRGDRAELKTYDDGPLRNDYTGNLADICPVGALTAKDFRFKCRVWFLERADSVCTQCAHGCNTTVSVNPNTRTLYRVEPRRNEDVNKSWICDTGRWDFHYVGKENRIKVPRRHYNGQWVEQPWQAFFSQMREEITAAPDKVLAALSTHLTNEEITDAVMTLKGLGVTHFMWVVDEEVVDEKQPYDGILKHRDLTSNAEGFKKMMEAQKTSWHRFKGDAEKLISGGSFDRILMLGLEGEAVPGAAKILAAVPARTKVAVHATNDLPIFEKVDWVVPAVSSYEKSGTVVNFQGRVQKLSAALPWQFTSRDTHALVFGLEKGGDRELSPAGRAQLVFEKYVVGGIFPGARTSWRKMSASGVNIGEKMIDG
jgi:NADH-quinone oxidoreductase subunit G